MSTLITPDILHTKLPITSGCLTLVQKTREDIARILSKEDDRLVVIVGPCSIHNTESALKYAKKLKSCIDKYQSSLCIIMRAYLEKARTSIGWKGFINDPHVNLTFDIEAGLIAGRSLLLNINALSVPTGTEILNPYLTPYFSDVISWAAIGARTTESQIHRELAASLPIPIGFKNNTAGDIQAAIDGVRTAMEPHTFLGLSPAGNITVVQASGNPHCHVVLRGSHQKTNYDAKTVHDTAEALNAFQQGNRIMIDCSHGNSQKNHLEQLNVVQALAERIKTGSHDFFGIMLESHLTAGKQICQHNHPIQPDQSITDPCIGWEETEHALSLLSEAVLARR